MPLKYFIAETERVAAGPVSVSWYQRTPAPASVSGDHMSSGKGST